MTMPLSERGYEELLDVADKLEQRLDAIADMADERGEPTVLTLALATRLMSARLELLADAVAEAGQARGR